MPTLVTLNESIEYSTEIKYEKDKSGLNQIITDITFDILQDSPRLVADVANKLIKSDVLDTVIVRNIDAKKYNIGIDRSKFIKMVHDYMFGYGPLQDYVDDESISDIDGTKYNEFTITRNGVRHNIDINFGNEEFFDKYCKLLIRRNYGIINDNDSQCRVSDTDNRLRINVSVRPRNVSGPAISIRKHRMNSYTLDDLKQIGMFGSDIKDFLYLVSKKNVNLVVCGNGGSGKTTLLRAIINNMPELDRVLICEKDAEIFPDKRNCIEQKIKNADEGGKLVTLRDLVTDGLTYTLDVYVIGESVGAEMRDGLSAAHSGHRFLTTTHSRKADKCLERLLTLSEMANTGESEKTLKSMIGSSIDLVIHMNKFKIVSIFEVLGYSNDSDDFQYNHLYNIRSSRIGSIGNRLKDIFEGGLYDE